jgi:rod shape-determining protein MreC
MQRSWIAGQSAALNSWVSGYIDEGVSYLKLKQINEDLVVQNKALMVELYGKDGAKNPVFKRVHDTIGGGQIYTFVDGEIVFNSINRRNNYLPSTEAAETVFSANGCDGSKGIAGIVINSTDSYALVQSVLSVIKSESMLHLKIQDISEL